MAGLSIPQMISNTATASGTVPPALAVQIASQESSFNPDATSNKGAMGLFQLMPATAASLGVTDPYDPVQNTQGGITYLSQLFNQFGNWWDALIAYNWGPTNVTNYGSAAAPTSAKNYAASAIAASGIAAPIGPVAPTGAAAPAEPDMYAAGTDVSLPSVAQASDFLPSLFQTSTNGTGGGAIDWLVLALIGFGVYLGAAMLFAE